MKPHLLLLSLLVALTTFAHPGIGIVKDRKGFIYYSDLTNIYKLDPSTGKTNIAVRNVHSHELFIDREDNLYGEHFWYADEATNRFDHYLWKLKANGKLDTISAISNAYGAFDFSVIRDLDGNQYRVQALTTDNILKKTKDGSIEVMASGAFKGISWLQPSDDGIVYFSNGNAIFKVVAKDAVVKITGPVAANEKDPAIYRIWQNNNGLYVAVASDRTIKKINNDGTFQNIFKEQEDWIITGGVFDNQGKLWVLEYNSKNEVRVIKGSDKEQTVSEQSFFSKYRGGMIGLLVAVIVMFIRAGKKQKRKTG